MQRIHGGAISSGRTVEQPFERVSLAAADEKRAIGVLAAGMVQSGQAILLDVGTTTTAIAIALLERTDLQDVVVITNALNIALALESAIPRFAVIVAGGTLRPMQHSLVDPLAGTVLDQVHADLAFIGCSGIDAETGVTNVNLPEADVKRRMIAASSRVVVVADASKVGAVHHSRVAPLSAVDTVVTGGGAPAERVSELERAGLRVVFAS